MTPQRTVTRPQRLATLRPHWEILPRRPVAARLQWATLPQHLAAWRPHWEILLRHPDLPRLRWALVLSRPVRRLLRLAIGPPRPVRKPLRWEMVQQQRIQTM